MKAQTGKVKTTSKAIHARVKVKNRLKTSAKPVVRPKAKPAAKAKPMPKSIAKPVARPAVKQLAKSVTKSARGAVVKAPGKRGSSAKAVVKPGVQEKKSGLVSKRVTRVIRTAPVKVVKPTAKVKSKDSVKTMIVKARKVEMVAVKSKAKSKSKSKAAPPVARVKVVPIAPLAKPTQAAPLSMAATSVPVRAGRPSSRLAQLTVPSMAQSVASTAAKASFTQTVSLPLIVPLLASALKKNPRLANNWKVKRVEQLTNAEVIAMPDDAYMNDTQMAFFRLRLIKLKQDILSNAGETTEHMRADTVVVPDPADRATIEEEHALELRTRDRERKLLKKIEQSIARIDSGDYGYCDETGEPIGVGRLLARPTANLSLEAQQRRELKQKMFGD